MKSNLELYERLAWRLAYHTAGRRYAYSQHSYSVRSVCVDTLRFVLRGSTKLMRQFVAQSIRNSLAAARAIERKQSSLTEIQAAPMVRSESFEQWWHHTKHGLEVS